MGIISTKAHTVIGLVVGLVLLVAPQLFAFTDNGAATTVAVAVGIFIILSELITKSPYSPLKLVSMKAHIVLDVVTGVFLAASPWLFSFMDTAQNNQWVPHLIVGLMVAGYALLTSPDDSRSSIIDRN